MRGKKILISLFTVIAMIFIVILIYTNSYSNKLELYSLPHPAIDFEQGDKIIFHDYGFAITGEHTRYYDLKGIETSCPFRIDGVTPDGIKVDAITDNHMLLNGSIVYRVNQSDLQELFEIDSPIIGIDEFDDQIFLIVKDEDEFLQLKCYDEESDELHDFELGESLHYIDFTYDDLDSSLSILALDINAPFPSSKILNYNEDFLLQGVISTIDEILYKAFRSPTEVLLFGTNRLICYNIEGDIQWEIESNSINDYQAVESDSQLLIYFDTLIRGYEEQPPFNTIAFSKKGELVMGNLPSHLSKVIPYKDKFIAQQHGKRLLVINKDFKSEQEYYIDYMEDMHWNERFPDNFYIVKQEGTLEVYSIKQEDYIE
ncbi:MAG TPA: hypothetical protein VFD57_06755 [Clostridia bacterium]|nr:hypothetical protein [Clostridia bacterium]